MIIGNGMLAHAFKEYIDNDSVLIFASGVSNSQEVDEKEFKREFELIERTLLKNPNKIFVYFSTCSMYDPLLSETPYVEHKIKMERYIAQHADRFLILRISQILGRGKNKTLVNFLYDKISSDEHFSVWKKSNRNLIALSDVFSISKQLIENSKYHNQTLHIANSMYISILELVHIFEILLDKKAKYTPLEKGEKYEIIPYDILDVIEGMGIDFNEDYYMKHLESFCLDVDDRLM